MGFARKWEVEEDEKLLAIVKQHNSVPSGCRFAAGTLDRSVGACSLHYYSLINKDKNSKPAEKALKSFKPPNIIEMLDAIIATKTMELAAIKQSRDILSLNLVV